MSVLFERGKFFSEDSTMTASVLSFYSLGLCGFFLQQIVTLRFLLTAGFQNARSHSGCGGTCKYNTQPLFHLGHGHSRPVLSTAICSYLQVLLLVRSLKNRFDRSIYKRLGITTAKTALATILMFAVGSVIFKISAGFQGGFYIDIIRLSAVVIICTGVYILAALLLKNEMLALLFQKKRE